MRIFAPLAGALLAIMFSETEAMVVPPWPIAPHDGQVGAESNVLDLLAASPDHHVLMRLLQRTRLVPEINRLQNHGTNLTFLAPLDSAWPPPIQDAFARDSVAEHTQQAALASFFNGTSLDPASVDAELADLLQYHIVNRSLLSQLLDPPASSGHHLESTLLVTHTGASEPGPDSTPLLTNNQQIFVNYTGNVTFGWSYGRTSNSSGTVRTAEGQYGLNCTKGVVVAVNRVLQRPPSLSTLIRTHSQLSLLSRLMDLGTGRFPFPVPLDSPDLTAFLPSDAALLPSTGNGLTPDESAWLEDPGDVLAAHDRAKLVAWHITADRKVIYRPSHERKQNITMALGGSYTLAPHRGGKRTQLGAANVIEESILVENGVVHLLDAALSPYRAPPARSILSMNMHRVLTARGAGQFADLLGKNGLGWAIDQPAWPTLEDIHEPSTESGPVHGSVPDRLTILALTDDFLTGLALPLNMSHGYLKKQKDQQGVSRENLRDQLSYHVLPAGWGLFNLTDPGMEVSSSKNWIQHRYLLPTELYPPGLGGRRQRLDVRIQIPLSEGSDEDDDHDPKGKRTHPGTRSSSGGVQVTFGGRAALDLEPITVGARGDILWFLRGALKPPKDVFNVLLGVGAGDLSQSSSSEGGVALFSSWLSATEKTRSLLERGENITGLVPRDDALSSQRLGKLLLNAITRSSFNLARVTEFAFVHDVMYTEDFPPRPSFDSRFEQVRLSSPALPVFRTLEGGNVTLGSYRQPKGDALYAATPERGADVVSVLHGKQDLLTNTGVLHLVDSLLFPADLEITIADLLLSSDLTEMYELVSKTRFAHILGGGSTTENSESNKTEGDPHAPKPYVLLAPKSGAFSPRLLALLRNDSDAREAFVAQHLIKLPGATDDCSLYGTSEYQAVGAAWAKPRLLPSWRLPWTWTRLVAFKKRPPGLPWPPAPPGPAPRINPLHSFTPLDLTDRVVWGTCANNRLNQLALRVAPPAESEDYKAPTTTSSTPTYLIGIHNAYGSATGKGHAAHLVDHGVQVPLRTEAPVSLETVHSGGVLLIDAVLVYNPLWNYPQQHWTAWAMTFFAIAGGCYLVHKLIQVCEDHCRALRLAEPLEGEEE